MSPADSVGIAAKTAEGDKPPPPRRWVELFDDYLMHGGYLTAINDLASTGAIACSTLATYSDWLRGDMLKRGKQEQYLREVLSAIVSRYGS